MPRISHRFTGKERDEETGLDYFLARYFSGAQGRSTTPDPTFMTTQRIGDPQQWNLYAYTRNNPLKFVDPDGMDLVLAASLSQKDRTYVVQNLARLYSTPAGRAYLERADRTKFTVEVGTGRLGRKDLTPAAPGAIVFGGKTHVTGGITQYGAIQAEGHKLLVAQSPDSPTAPPIQVTIDKSQAAEMGKDPAVVFAHELGGHTADVLNAAESNPAQFIEAVNPKDETSSEAAERAIGKPPDKLSAEAVKAVEELLKKKEKQP